MSCSVRVVVIETATKLSRSAPFLQGAESLAPAKQNDIRTSKSGPNRFLFFCILTWKCASCHKGAHFFDMSTSKSGLNRCFFSILTWKCASRHLGVHFFDMLTSKSGPNRCFLAF